jgi:S1-C subfamily serine protease
MAIHPVTLGERRLLRQRRSSVLTSGEIHQLSDVRHRAWLKSTLHLAVVAALLWVAAANLRARAGATALEDGVLWQDHGGAITAVEVAPESPAFAAGIRRGDVLEMIDGQPVFSERQVLESLHATRKGQSLNYAVARVNESRIFEVPVAPVPS